MKLFAHPTECESAAIKAGLVGLTDSGQSCGAVGIIPEGWFFHTAHNFWGKEPPGDYLLDGGVVKGDSPEAEEFLDWIHGYGGRPPWLERKSPSRQ